MSAVSDLQPIKKRPKTGGKVAKNQSKLKKDFHWVQEPFTDAEMQLLTSTAEQKESYNAVAQKCKICERIFNVPTDLVYHNWFHQGWKLRCNHCDFACGISRKMCYLHFRNKHENYIRPKVKVEVKRRCPKCELVFPNLTELKKHVDSKHDCYRELCKFCKKTFLYEKMRDEHEKIIHEGLGHKCDKCNLIFLNEIRMIKHSAKCSGCARKIRPLVPCDKCGKEVRSNKMAYHMKKHMDLKPPEKKPCPICQKKVQLIREHIKKVHLEEYKFICQTCGAKFSSNLHMTEHHKVVHQHIRYKCCYENCPKEYRAKGGFHDQAGGPKMVIPDYF
jgi:hypothetical protein